MDSVNMAGATITNSVIVMGSSQVSVSASSGALDEMELEVLRLMRSFSTRQRVMLLSAGYAIEDENFPNGGKDHGRKE